MTECARRATRSKETYFSFRYRCLVVPWSKKRALVAIAAKMLKEVYRMLKDGSKYGEVGQTTMTTDANRRKLTIIAAS